MKELQLILILTFALIPAAATAAIFQSQPVGIQVGDGTTAAIQASDNLIYGVLATSTAGSLILLQNGDGNDRFRVNYAGNTTIFGTLTVSGKLVCLTDGTNCPASVGTGWADSGTTIQLATITDNVIIGSAGVALTKLDVRGAVGVPSGLGNTAARPTVGKTRIQGEIAGIGGATPAMSWDDGFLRLSAGGGAVATVKSYIDLSGYSTIPDMQQNIVFGTSGQERLRIDSSGNLTMKSVVFNAIGSVFYVNANGDAQIRIDTNNDGVNKFTINNGLNATVFIVDESGNTTLSGLLQLPLGAAVNEFSTDTSLAGSSNSAVPTENAVKTYVDATVAAAGGSGTYTYSSNGHPGNTVLNSETAGLHVCTTDEWVGRTGTNKSSLGPVGGLWIYAPIYSSSSLNCSAWTSNSQFDSGMIVTLSSSGWKISTMSCNNVRPSMLCSD
ncbi:hypothetical protein BK004_00050 [bacterium CG10_46_32]|nr:MAG: hypothetical protein BK004_00050 [bacterium CG10_46_32]PIR56515.1 MAG: hypothetical protein COU73_00050 [Parcubacteria group bacterium CG10_big_fil_rev_8_21_14_0_10_46_32]